MYIKKKYNKFTRFLLFLNATQHLSIQLHAIKNYVWLVTNSSYPQLDLQSTAIAHR